MIKPFRIDPFVFRQIVPADGYEWQEGRYDSQPHLVSRGTIGGHAWIKEPTKMNSGLFLDFANLKPTQEAILQFANDWGDIFNRYGPDDLMPQQKGRLPFLSGASIERWKDEIDGMQVFVRLWEATKDRNVTQLKKVITWANGGVRYSITTRIGQYNVWLAHPETESELLERFTPKDVVLPAKYALQQRINERLAHEETLSKPQLVWTRDMNQRIIFTPINLRAAMWLQFAQAVTGEFQLKRCEGCGKYYQSGPGGRRIDATTCSDACRQRKRRKNPLRKKSAH